MEDVRIRGSISSAGFPDGNRFVIGYWLDSPIGEFGDVMWGTSEGKKILLARSERIVNFVSAIYDFDEVRIGDLQIVSRGRSTYAMGFGLDIALNGGRIRGIIPPRPLFFTRYIESPIASFLMGVETFGTSSRGVMEWYQAEKWRRVTSGTVSLHGRDLGSLCAFTQPLGVGFSEPPRIPSIVDLDVTIRFPDSTLL